jgi:hypothetical protein
MHGLALIRPITKSERLNLEKLYKGCEAPGCPKQPQCAIVRETSGEIIIVFVWVDHARSWAADDEDAKPNATGCSDDPTRSRE